MYSLFSWPGSSHIIFFYICLLISHHFYSRVLFKTPTSKSLVLRLRETRSDSTDECPAARTYQGKRRQGRHRCVQGEVFSRKAQLINCWLVSREDDRVEPDLWTSTQTLSVAPKIPTLLPDNIIQSKYLISILYPIIIGLDRKTSFGSFYKIQRTTNTSTRYVHLGQGYSPFNTLHQSHLITIKNCKNQ